MSHYSNAKTKLYGIGKGKKGIVQTLKLMRSITNRFKKNIKIRELAQNIVKDVKGKDYFNEAKYLQNWVRDNIRYIKDIQGVETIATPDHTLFVKQGDCDDQSILLASLLGSIGHSTRFVVVGPLPGIYSHVYVETKINGAWLPVETTENWIIGKGPPVVRAKMILNNRVKNNIGQADRGNLMTTFADIERELDAELEALVIANELEKAGYTLQDYYNGLNGIGEMAGLLSKWKKKIDKKTSKIRKKIRGVVRVAAVAVAAYYTGGAAAAAYMAYKKQKAAAKAAEARAIAEDDAIKAQNARIMADEAKYSQLLMDEKGVDEARILLKKKGIAMNSPGAKAYLAKSIKLASAKMAAGQPAVEPTIIKKLAPIAIVGVPLIAAMAL